MKKILTLLFISQVYLLANDDSVVNGYWNKAIEQTDILWNKTKQITNDAVDGTKKLSTVGLTKTKSALLQGKTFLLEKTLLTSINLGLDYNNTIVVDKLSINDTNGTLSLMVTLIGEEQKILIDVRHFDWDVINDKKEIVLENLYITIDTPWLDYLVKKYLKQHNGYLKVPYTFAKETFLSSLKGKTKTTYVSSSDNKQLSAKDELYYQVKEILVGDSDNKYKSVFQEFYDENYIKADLIAISDKGLEITIYLTGSKEPLHLILTHFDWATANDKKLVVIGNITFANSTKTWVSAILQKHHKQIVLDYNDMTDLILSSIKAKTQGSIENIEIK